jgi:hypothetical protein
MDRRVFHLGNMDRNEVARAHEPGELDGIPPVSVHAISRLLGDLGSHDA